MHLLLAPDKFKGTLTAAAVISAIATGIELGAKHPHTLTIQPLADGGDGSLAILKHQLDLHTRQLPSIDPLGRPIHTSYLTNNGTAFIEVASASGLALLKPAERQVLKTSTRGTGLLVKDAIARGCTRIYLFLGGSATNDLGLGIAAALGFKFLNASQQEVEPNGGQLGHIKYIKTPSENAWQAVSFTLLCDVDNPLYGPNGAAHVYAAQKGASPTEIEILDAGLQSSSALIEQQFGKKISDLPGSGAAGGIAAGLVGLLNAHLQAGFKLISELTDLEAKVAKADLVISGEGKLDGQSLQGKVVGGLAQLCKKYDKPLYLFVGTNELTDRQLTEHQITKVYAVTDRAPSLADAMQYGEGYLRELGKEFALKQLNK